MPVDLRTQVASLQPRSIAAKLRPLLPDIDKKLRDGSCLDDIHKILVAGGIPVTRSNLLQVIKRWRKRQSTTGSTEVQKPDKSPAPGFQSALSPPIAPIPSKDASPNPIRTRTDLVRLRDQPIDLNQFTRPRRPKS